MKAYLIKPLNLYNYTIFLYVVIALALPIVLPQGFEVLYLSSNYSNAVNLFFTYITKFAEWPGILFFAVVVLYFNRSKSFPFAIACLLTFAAISFLKQIAFPSSPRPRLWASLHQIQIPETASSLMQHSFPSGHTAFAVCMFFCLSVLFQKKNFSLIFAVLAILVALSRVYLMAHFVIDTAIGAMLGLFFGIFGNYLFDLYRVKHA